MRSTLVRRIKDMVRRWFPFVMPIWECYRNRQRSVEAKKLYLNDYNAMVRHSIAFDSPCREAALAHIIMNYHVIEKGLTMPNRHLWFGQSAVLELMQTLTDFERRFGVNDIEFRHGVGVVKSYMEMHAAAVTGEKDAERMSFWARIMAFCDSHFEIPPSRQFHFSREEFYRDNLSPFDKFARSRHTCRHFVEGATIPDEEIKAAVSLAQTSPSACNRQHVRVHCVSDPALKERVRALQGGNRGFGHLADKFLVVTSDISDLYWAIERYDLYTNAGIFVMNLCYALHFHKIAHCILHCSMKPDRDRELRNALSIPESERFVCMIACGKAPDEFDVAASKRKPVETILSMH